MWFHQWLLVEPEWPERRALRTFGSSIVGTVRTNRNAYQYSTSCHLFVYREYDLSFPFPSFTLTIHRTSEIDSECRALPVYSSVTSRNCDADMSNWSKSSYEVHWILTKLTYDTGSNGGWSRSRSVEEDVSHVTRTRQASLIAYSSSTSCELTQQNELINFILFSLSTTSTGVRSLHCANRG